MSARRGFTLIELVIVIAIIGILASLAVPKYLDLSTQAKYASLKSALGTIRAAVKTKYAASATAGGVASYPTTLSATDFADGRFPENVLVASPGTSVVYMFASKPANCSSGFTAYWYITDTASTDIGAVGACCPNGPDCGSF